jgi:hypothetical protein
MSGAMLLWVHLFQASMSSATDGGVAMQEVSTVDPLKKIVIATFRDPIPNRTCWIAFQIIAHAFAAANDCVIQRIRKLEDKRYGLEILTKTRKNTSSKDPFVDTWKSNAQKRREEFQKYLRDKAKELEEDASYVPEPTSPLPADPNQWR